MATVMLSSTVAERYISNSGGQGYLIHTAANTPPQSVISGGQSSDTLLIIHKGTPETFPSFADRSTRASDVLISFSLPSTTGSYTALGLVGNAQRFIVGKCLTLTSATASGLASWFLLCRSGTTSLTNKGAMIGSVGLVGTGADLEISSTNIVSGQYYTSAGIYINFPRTFTF